MDVEVFLYDDLAQPTGLYVVAIGTAPGPQAELGLRSSMSGSLYSSATDSLASWQVTGVPRAQGWRRLAFAVDASGTRFFIDGVLVRSEPVPTSIEWVQFLCGDHGYGPENATVSFDDVSVTATNPASPASDILSSDLAPELPDLPDRRFGCVTLPWLDPDDPLASPVLAPLLFYRHETGALPIALTKTGSTLQVLLR